MKFQLALQILSRLLLGIVFIYASIEKIIDPVSFSSNIDNYHITPIELNNLAALIIPWIEIVIGLSLIFGAMSLPLGLYYNQYFLENEKFVKASALIAVVLLILFIFFIAQAYWRGIDLHCGCFKNNTILSNANLKQEMVNRMFEDIIYLGFGLFVYFRHYDKED